jgi:hypothetical protein
MIMPTKRDRVLDERTLKRRRLAALAELRTVLSDMDGLCVGRVSYRSGRMIIWLRPRDVQEPVMAIKLRRLVAFRDNGIGGTRLTHGAVVEGGVWGRNLAETHGKPHLATYFQLDLWNNLSKNGPAFQALARDVRVYQGAGLSPDRIWKS